MLVSAKEMLNKAKAGKYAVGQFNINNLEWTKAILLTAQENNSPVILGVSEGAGKYMCGYNTVVGMVNGMLETLKITVPVALHLDHGSYDGALACIDAGFSSIMFDGSHYPIEENIAKTKELIRIAGEKGISVEAEVGAIGGEEDGVVGGGEVGGSGRVQDELQISASTCSQPASATSTASIRQAGRPQLRRAREDSGAHRHDAARSPRRYGHPGRHDQEGDFPRRFQDQRQHRVPARLC